MFDLPSSDDVADLKRLSCEADLREFLRGAWPYFDPSPYSPSWAVDAMAEHVTAVLEGELRFLLITVPARHSKSSLLGVAAPAWSWARERIVGQDGVPLPTLGPESRWMTLSYDRKLATRDAQRSRALLDSPWFQNHWGHRFNWISDQNEKQRYANDAGGERISLSISQGVTGEGFGVCVLDDPISATDVHSATERENVLRFFSETLQTRMNDPRRSAIIVVMQRLHTDDLAAEILRRDLSYEHLCLPARFNPSHKYVYGRDLRTTPGEPLWPARFGQAELDKLAAALGPYAAEAQLDQHPRARAAGFFDTDRIQLVESLPVDASGEPVGVTRRVRAYDLAATAHANKLDPSWTACVLMSQTVDGYFWIEDVQRWREPWSETERRIKRIAELDGRNVDILLPKDPGQAGVYQASALTRMLAGWNVELEPQTGSKETRSNPLSGQVGAGNVRIVRGHDDDPPKYIKPFLDELTAFPGAKHKDQVDAASSAFNALTSRSQRAMVLGGGRSAEAQLNGNYQSVSAGVFGGGERLSTVH